MQAVLGRRRREPSSAASSPLRELSRANSAADVNADAENEDEGLGAPSAGLERKKLQVSVLVAMPSPHASVKGKERSISVGHDDWDEEFPDVVVGTAEAIFAKTTAPSSPSTSSRIPSI
jgi:hypothetical protein